LTKVFRVRETFFYWGGKMKSKNSYNFAIIGLGKVGTAIGHLLNKSGHKIIAIADKYTAALKRMPCPIPEEKLFAILKRL